MSFLYGNLISRTPFKIKSRWAMVSNALMPERWVAQIFKTCDWQATLITKFMGQHGARLGADRTQMGPILALWILLSGYLELQIQLPNFWQFQARLMKLLKHGTHCGLVIPYGDRDFGQDWFKQRPVAWQHQAISWANVDLPCMRSFGIQSRKGNIYFNTQTINHHILFEIYIWNYGHISQRSMS